MLSPQLMVRCTYGTWHQGSVSTVSLTRGVWWGGEWACPPTDNSSPAARRAGS